MKILNWMQNKINGGQGRKRPTVYSNCQPKQEVCKEEFSDWPEALLAIGTFGNHQSEKDLDRHGSSEIASAPHCVLDFIEEEVGKFQMELRKLLSLKPLANVDHGSRGEDLNLQLDRVFNSPSRLEADLSSCEKPCNDLDDDEDDFSRNASVILNKAKEICIDKNNGIGQRSISFLLKKMFLCHGGFVPTPSLRDPIPEYRMEKLLREILLRKILSKKYSASSSPRKYLAHKHSSKNTSTEGQGEQKKEDNGSKWIKTDSDFIVLEM